MKRTLFILFIFFSLLLSACVPILSTDTRLDLGGDEEWKILINLLLPALDAEANIIVLQTALSEALPKIQAQGIQVEWGSLDPDNNGDTPFLITMSGKGYSLLNDAIFDGEQVLSFDLSSPGQKRILFNLQPTNDLFSSAAKTTFTLRGGKVVATNGTQLDDSTVQWTNPNGIMEAVIEEAGSTSWLGYLLLIVGGGLLVIAILGLRGAFKKRPVPGGYPPIADTYSHLEAPPNLAADAHRETEVAPGQSTPTHQEIRDSTSHEEIVVDSQAVMLPHADVYLTHPVESIEDITAVPPEAPEPSEQEGDTEVLNIDISESPVIYPKFCARCGLPWPTGGNFCPRCGKPLN